ncbi:siderophore-interacting protein [Corynebacterium bovis]|uniref:Siderophore-interacting protein n=1 Tax=Corynebacterium bovis TaxID=36808 RepID=A0A3R8PF08_9CORY|nr:siderophore-interacting protein [Corynebacterium bovis]RRQ03660.1 siderophore-interacting protein [Corynebacterium bovis]RRQ08250.1 siderophore-interacting protein [Corynebacterium bovis]RRQ09467.1 siderophore-interacting protein [Corynebacterium bovis]RRQ11103.1 siderophore-interacting protein [Corynebacterium bovis]
MRAPGPRGRPGARRHRHHSGARPRRPRKDPVTTTPATAVRDLSLPTEPGRADTPVLPATVTAVTSPAASIRRLTLSSPAFRDLVLTGPDEYLGLLMPEPGRAVPPVDPTGTNLRAAVNALPAPDRPLLRWYSVRNLRRDAVAPDGSPTGEIDVDVLVHGDSGPGSRWALRARPGRRCAVSPAGGIWCRASTRQLLVADPTAVPALRSILEFTRDHHPAELADLHVAVLASGPADLEPGLRDEWEGSVGTLATVTGATVTEQAREVTTLLSGWAAAGHPATGAGYAWVCGEQGLCKDVRRVLVDTWGLAGADVRWVTYWILGRERP